MDRYAFKKPADDFVVQKRTGPALKEIFERLEETTLFGKRESKKMIPGEDGHARLIKKIRTEGHGKVGKYRNGVHFYILRQLNRFLEKGCGTSNNAILRLVPFPQVRFMDLNRVDHTGFHVHGGLMYNPFSKRLMTRKVRHGGSAASPYAISAMTLVTAMGEIRKNTELLPQEEA